MEYTVKDTQWKEVGTRMKLYIRKIQHMTELEGRKRAGGSTSALANMGIMSPIMKI